MWIEIEDKNCKAAMGYLLLAGHKEFVEIALAIEDAVARAKAAAAFDRSEDRRQVA